MRRTFISVVVLAGLVVAASANAQRPDSSHAPPPLTPPGAFVGIIKNSVNGAHVQSADLRLYFIDSARVVRGVTGDSVIDTFIDTTRSRLAVSDSTGSFFIWRLAAGQYVMNVRRIGYAPMEAVVTIDTSTVLFDFTMAPVSQLLASVNIVEKATNWASRRQERVGFTSRSKFGMGQYIKPDEMMKRKPITLRDILSVYGLRESAEYMFDRMSLDYYDIQDYPADEIAGIEIYRHNRPMEFNRTRGGAGIMSPGGMANLMRPLVVVWTY